MNPRAVVQPCVVGLLRSMDPTSTAGSYRILRGEAGLVRRGVGHHHDGADQSAMEPCRRRFEKAIQGHSSPESVQGTRRADSTARRRTSRTSFPVVISCISEKGWTVRGLNPGPYTSAASAKHTRYHCANSPSLGGVAWKQKHLIRFSKVG